MSSYVVLCEDRRDDTEERVSFFEKCLTTCCCCAPVRKCSSIKDLEWAFLTLSLADICFLLLFTIKDLIRESSGSDNYIIGWTILFTTGICLIYILRGVLAMAHPSEVVAYMITLLALFVYSFTTCKYNNYDAEALGRLMTVAILICLCVAALWKHKPWRKDMCDINNAQDHHDLLTVYFMCKSLIIVNMQYQVCMVFFALSIRFRTEHGAIGGISSACVIAFIWICCGILGMRYENKPALVVFFFCSTWILAFDIFRLADVLLKQAAMLYTVSTSVCACISIVLTLAVVILMGMVWNNFGKGVKDLIRLVPPSACMMPINDHMQGA